jgi:hypothetical protein
MNARRASVVVADGPGQRRVAGLQRVQHRALGYLACHVQLDWNDGGAGTAGRSVKSDFTPNGTWRYGPSHVHWQRAGEANVVVHPDPPVPGVLVWPPRSSLLVARSSPATVTTFSQLRSVAARPFETQSRRALTRHNSQPGADVVQQAPVPRWGWGVAPPYQP